MGTGELLEIPNKLLGSDLRWTSNSSREILLAASCHRTGIRSDSSGAIGSKTSLFISYVFGVNIGLPGIEYLMAD